MTMFEKLSSNKESMAKYIAEHVIDEPCYLICDGECPAINGLSQTADQICMKKILAFLDSEAGDS